MVLRPIVPASQPFRIARHVVLGYSHARFAARASDRPPCEGCEDFTGFVHPSAVWSDAAFGAGPPVLEQQLLPKRRFQLKVNRRRFQAALRCLPEPTHALARHTHSTQILVHHCVRESA